MPAFRSNGPARRLRKALRLATIAGASLIASAATFQPAALVLDINTNPVTADSLPGLICDGPSFALFYSESGGVAYRLWRTDGSTGGTVELGTYPTSQFLSGFACVLADGPGPMLFRFTNGDGRWELWRTDGTAAGTFRLLLDPDGQHDLKFLGVAGLPLLAANVEGVGNELVATDGTVAGTRVVRDITPGPDNTFMDTEASVLGGRVHFVANGDLWSSDGTTTGTRLVIDLDSRSVDDGVDGFARLGSRLLFGHTDSNSVSNLWTTDGTTAGSSILRSFPWPAGELRITGLASVGNSRGVFALPDPDGPPYWKLWRTDGTAGGTQQVAVADPDLDFLGPQFWPVPGGLVFAAYTPATGAEIWFTDGTDGSTRLVHETLPGSDGVYVEAFHPVPQGVFYRDYYPVPGHRTSLWFSDGTTPGTWSVSATHAQLAAQDVMPYAPAVDGSGFLFWSTPPQAGATPPRQFSIWRGSMGSRSVSLVREFAQADLYTSATIRPGRLFFSVNVPPYGYEPWVSDGTSSGTRLLRNLEPESSNGSSLPRLAFTLGNAVLFAADDGVQGNALWRSDGTAAGTIRLSSGAPVLTNPFPAFARIGGTVLYPGANSAGLSELWRTDGTAAGTRQVIDLSGIAPGDTQVRGSRPASCGAGFVVNANQAWYGASPLGIGKLFRSDGSAAGTVEVGAFPGRPRVPFASSSVCVLAAFNGGIYFQAMDPDTDIPVLWRSDMQTGAFAKVLSSSGLPIFAPTSMAEAGGELYFFTGQQDRIGLWRLTSTDPVGRLVVERTWPAVGGFPVIAETLGSILLFKDCEAGGAAPACSLYRTDGTAMGTQRLSSAQPPGQAGRPYAARVGNRVAYMGRAVPGGYELWFTDGTPAGTSSTVLSVTEPTYTTHLELYDFNGLLYVTTPTKELWRTDGTVAGTERANTGPEVVRFEGALQFAVSGNRLLFAGGDDTRAYELWAIENQAPLVQADSGATTAPAAVMLDVLANDTDPDGALARSTVRITQAPAGGSAVVDAATGQVRYTPASGFSGSDSFQYVVSDNQRRESAPVTASVTVTAAPGGGGGGGGGGGSGGGSGGGGSAGWLELLALAGVLVLSSVRKSAIRQI